jgi:hypothetical protein
MRDEIEGEDPTKILEEVARNYQPSNEDNIINCEFFESPDNVPDPNVPIDYYKA